MTGKVAIGGSTGQLVGRNLLRLAGLIDRSLAEVRLEAGMKHAEDFSVAGFLEEIAIGASMQAHARDIEFTVSNVASVVTINGDRPVLIAAVSNLLQNAFKFTGRGGSVSLVTQVTTDRVLFHVEDECGGLPKGKIDELFAPFSQRGRDRSGLGLGLFICRKAAEANGGTISARDLAGKGCIFTLDVPRRPPPPLSMLDGGGGKPNPPSPKRRGRAREGAPVKARGRRS
jgi:signal transduction histidine kinase